MALHALVANKLRTSLSLLGITIGIFAIIVVFTAVDSLEMNIRDRVESLGDDVIFIQSRPWGVDEDGEYKWWDYIKRPNPSMKELEMVKRKTRSAQACAFAVTGNKTIQYKNNSVENATLSAVSLDYDKIISFDIASGRYFSESEAISGRNMVLIGATIAVNLFGPLNPLGRSIKLMGRSFVVSGVIKKEGESIVGQSHDTQVLIPINTARKLIDIDSRQLNPMIMVKAKEGISNKQLKAELKGVMRSIRKLKPLADDNFALNETSILGNLLDVVFKIIKLAGLFIGGFSILVGGFGIANIMFVSVKERTHIIGIQKSLGAKNYFILLQFLFESIILCMIGGVIGLLIVYGGTIVASSFIDLKFVLTYTNIAIGLGVSIGIGIISGLIPAYSASRLDPVEAIRAN